MVHWLQQYRTASEITALAVLLIGVGSHSVLHAQAQELESSLSVQVLRDSHPMAAASGTSLPARPGDLLEYQLSYRNKSARSVGRLQATLPIPPGTLYEKAAHAPLAPLASVDGRTFLPTPLTRMERQGDGRLERVLVPLQEYKAVRWPLPDLAPGQSVTVRAWARISDGIQTSGIQNGPPRR